MEAHSQLISVINPDRKHRKSRNNFTSDSILENSSSNTVGYRVDSDKLEAEKIRKIFCC